MSQKKESNRKRSRPVTKKKKFDMKYLIPVIIVVIIVIAGAYFVLNMNEPPTAKKDYIAMDVNSDNYLLNILGNDVDPDGQTLSIKEIKDPTNGVISTEGSKYYFTPTTNFSGVETIEYTIVDEKGAEASSEVHLIIKNNPVALMDTSLGMIVLELYKDKMPNTCANFIKLSNDGFYDGMNFYRVSDDFMIQAGRYFPDGSEDQSPYGTINFEESDVKHVDGAISMARSQSMNSASAEFFICDQAQEFLDGQYAAFGVTIDGIDVVHDIAAQPNDGAHPAGGGKPYDDILINSVEIKNND